MIDTGRLFDFDLLFLDNFDFLRLDSVMERKLDNFSVLNGIELLGVVLEHCGVTRHNLKLVRRRVAALFRCI